MLGWQLAYFGDFGERVTNEVGANIDADGIGHGDVQVHPDARSSDDKLGR